MTRREDRSGNDYKCWDYWEYRFCLQLYLHSDVQVQGRVDQVCDWRCSRCGDQTNPSFRSTSASSAGSLRQDTSPAPHDCRNSSCYKIFDPADEVTAAVAVGAVLTSLGVVFLCIAVGIAICVRCAVMRQSNQRSYQSSIPQPGVAMVPVATTTVQVPMAMAQPMVQPVAMAVGQPAGAPPMAYPQATAATGYPQAAGYPQPMAMPVAQPCVYPQAAGYPQGAAGYPQATGYPTAA